MNSKHVPMLEKDKYCSTNNRTGNPDRIITHLSEDKVKMLSEQELDTHTSLYTRHSSLYEVPQAHFRCTSFSSDSGGEDDMSITSLEMSLHLEKRIWKMNIVT